MFLLLTQVRRCEVQLTLRTCLKLFAIVARINCDQCWWLQAMTGMADRQVLARFALPHRNFVGYTLRVIRHTWGLGAPGGT